MAEELNNFEEIERKKKSDFRPVLNQTPFDDWPDALDHLTIGLVANEYTKLGKTSENLILSLGLSHIKNPSVIHFSYVCFFSL